ncbi:MAG: hypothetical protein IT440_12735 [Phycisphaeraceae bacterium]|nr:hypothetical protein [Phycisphaeraceae bacterium]
MTARTATFPCRRPVCAGAWLCGAAWSLMTLAGCSPMELRGTVIEGDPSGVQVVSANDPRLRQHGVSGVNIEATLDPDSLRPQRLGAQTTDSAGQFVLPIDVMGAGSFQMYELGLLCTARGYRDVWQSINLPDRSRRLLIIMAPGRGGNRPLTDILDETMKMKDDLLSK